MSPQPHEQLLMGWMVHDMMTMMTRWVGMTWTTRDGEANGNDGPGSPMPDDDAHGNGPLRYKQLLVGRMAGASDNDNDNGKGWDNDNNSKRQDHWVGGRQRQPDKEGRRRRDETMTPAPTLTCHDDAPPPVS